MIFAPFPDLRCHTRSIRSMPPRMGQGMSIHSSRKCYFRPATRTSANVVPLEFLLCRYHSMPCRFQDRGQCRSGMNCWFKHRSESCFLHLNTSPSIRSGWSLRNGRARSDSGPVASYCL